MYECQANSTTKNSAVWVDRALGISEQWLCLIIGIIAPDSIVESYKTLSRLSCLWDRVWVTGVGAGGAKSSVRAPREPASRATSIRQLPYGSPLLICTRQSERRNRVCVLNIHSRKTRLNNVKQASLRRKCPREAYGARHLPDLFHHCRGSCGPRPPSPSGQLGLTLQAAKPAVSSQPLAPALYRAISTEEHHRGPHHTSSWETFV